MSFIKNLVGSWEIKLGPIEVFLWVAITVAVAYGSYISGSSISGSSISGSSARTPSQDSRRIETTLVLEGAVEEVKLRNEKTGFTVVRLKPINSVDVITVVGRFPEPYAGQTMRVEGLFVVHPKYGLQFSAKKTDLLDRAQSESSPLMGAEIAVSSDGSAHSSELSLSQPLVAETAVP